MYSGDITLAVVAFTDVIMSTQAKYRQVDGRVMGSPPAPPLCSMWLSKFKLTIKGNTKLLNDIWMTHRTTTESLIGHKLSKIKSLLPTLNSH